MRISDWSSDVCSSDLDEMQTPVMIGEGPVAAGQLSDVPAEAGNTAEAAPDEIIVTARSEAPPGDPLQNVNIEAFQVAQSVDKALVGPIAKGYEGVVPKPIRDGLGNALRSEGHTSELQSLMRISSAPFCLKKKKQTFTT